MLIHCTYNDNLNEETVKDISLCVAQLTHITGEIPTIITLSQELIGDNSVHSIVKESCTCMVFNTKEESSLESLQTPLLDSLTHTSKNVMIETSDGCKYEGFVRELRPGEIKWYFKSETGYEELNKVVTNWFTL